MRLPKGMKVTIVREIKLNNGVIIPEGTKGTLVDPESHGGHWVQFDDGPIRGVPGVKDLTVSEFMPSIEPDIKSLAELLDEWAKEYAVDNTSGEETKQKYFTLKYAADMIMKLSWRDTLCTKLADKVKRINKIVEEG